MTIEVDLTSVSGFCLVISDALNLLDIPDDLDRREAICQSIVPKHKFR